MNSCIIWCDLLTCFMCFFIFFFSRTKKKLDQVRQQLKDVKVTDDKAEQLKQQLTDLEKKVRKSQDITTLNLLEFRTALFAK